MGDLERLSVKIQAKRILIADLRRIRAEAERELEYTITELAKLEKAWELFTR